MKTLYIGCALNQAPSDFLAMIEGLKTTLANDFELLSFIGLSPDATPAEVYATDIDCASRADLMLAVADRPSTGLGMEIQKRIELGKPTVIAYMHDNAISRMVLGAAVQHEQVVVLPYKTVDDIIATITTYA